MFQQRAATVILEQPRSATDEELTFERCSASESCGSADPGKVAADRSEIAHRKTQIL